MSIVSSERDSPLRILVIRPDRIGDVILSTPVLEVIRRHYPKAKLTMMVQELVAPLIRGLPSVDQVLIYEPKGRHAGFRGFFRLVDDLRKGRFRIAIVLQTEWRLALATVLADIRYRVGPLSRPHSFLLFNRGIRQRRSQVEMHEADYNLQLLRRLGIRVGTRNVSTTVAVSNEKREWAHGWLKEHGWKEGESLVAVHPGMGGSALNWPEANYIELIRALVRDSGGPRGAGGPKVLVTGGPGEGALLSRVEEALRETRAADPSRLIFYGGPGTGTVDHLGALFAQASLVVAPSTGPVHVAVALGKPVLTFYPPIRVQSAVRWGPYVREESQVAVMVPEVYCGQDFKCAGPSCHYYSCMKGLTVGQALDEARRLLETRK